MQHNCARFLGGHRSSAIAVPSGGKVVQVKCSSALLQILFLTENRTGCRFITVDAYNNERTIAFYEQNEFRFLSSSDATEDTRQMYFDLKPFADLMQQTGQGAAGEIKTGDRISRGRD